MPKLDVTDDQLETLRTLYFPRRSAAERFTDAVFTSWLIWFTAVLVITGIWILQGGHLPN